jgi:hypothetical protein
MNLSCVLVTPVRDSRESSCDVALNLKLSRTRIIYVEYKSAQLCDSDYHA